MVGRVITLHVLPQSCQHVEAAPDVTIDDGRPGSPHMWGMGRHAIGSNWFWYLREPSGTFVEYTADIDRITSQDLYVPKEWPGHEYLYAAGPPPPPQFIEPDDMAELIAAASAS